MARQTAPIVFFLVAVGVLAGFAGGYLAGASSQPVLAAEGDSSVLRNVSAQPAPNASAPSGPAAVLPLGRTADTLSPRNLEGPSEARVADAVAATRRPSAPVASGSGSIRGTVTSRDGDPIDGITVRVMPARVSVETRRGSAEARPRNGAPRSLEDALARAARDWARRGGSSFETTTDASGAFTIHGIGEGRFEVRPDAPAWRFTARGAEVVEAGAEVNFVGVPMPAVDLQLVSADGGAITEAILRVHENRGSQWLEWTSSEPKLYVESAQFDIVAYVEPYPSGTDGRFASRYASERLSIDATAQEGPLTVTVHPTCTLMGRILGERAHVGTNASVFAIPLMDGSDFDPTLPVTGGKSERERRGVFVFSDLRPGPHAVGVTGPGGVPSDHEIVDLTFGLTEITLDRPNPEDEKWLIVNVLSPTGTPVESVNIWFEFQEASDDVETEWVTRQRDGAGRYLLDTEDMDEVDYENAPAGTRLWLAASSEIYGRARVEVSGGQREAELRFGEPCGLEVQIEGNISMGGYSILVKDMASGRDEPPKVADAHMDRGIGARHRIDDNGRVTFRGLSAGPVKVTLNRSGRWWGNGVEVAAEEIVLSGKGHTLTFQAVDVSNLMVVMTPSEDDRWVGLERKDDDGDDEQVASGKVGDDGRILLRGIAPGAYTLKDYETGATLEVTMPCSEVRFDVSEHVKKLTVSVSKQDGQLAKWGFLGGDLITAVDGEPVDDSEALYKKLDKQAVTVTVLRGEESVDMELSQYPKDTRSENPLGGWIWVDS